MLKSLALNRFLWGIAGLTAVFFALRETVEPDLLMSILNGLFAGSVVTIVAAYYRLIWAAVRGDGDYDRVRQMTLGLFLLWAAMVLNVLVSIYARSTEFEVTTYTGAAASRYIAIIAAVMQIMSLDYGFALFHGRDKMMLWTGLFLGALVAVVTVVIQNS